MNVLNRRSAIVAALGLLGAARPAWAVAQPTVEVWKSPTCGCCKDWVTHMESHGFTVRVHDTGNTTMRQRLGRPQNLGAWAAEGRRLQRARNRHTAVLPRAPIGTTMGFSVSPRCTGFRTFRFDAFCRPRS